LVGDPEAQARRSALDVPLVSISARNYQPALMRCVFEPLGKGADRRYCSIQMAGLWARGLAERELEAGTER